MTAPGTQLQIGRLGEGWIAEEALAISLACALAYPEDWSSAVLLAVNHGGDSDSTGAITGALLGARLGMEAIPLAWSHDVECASELVAIADRLSDTVRGEASFSWVDGV